MKLIDIVIGNYVYFKKHTIGKKIDKNKPYKVEYIKNGRVKVEGIEHLFNTGTLSSIPCIEKCKLCPLRRW